MNKPGAGETTPDVTRGKKLLFTGVMIFAIALATAALGEITIRVIKTFGYSTFVFRQFDPVLGTGLIPGSSGKHQRCYDGYVVVNQHGMRDRERSELKPPGTFRIGVFGDSFTEAVHVHPDETATHLLEERLNREVCDGRCEVLNFSVATYSTLQELLRYRTLGREFDLDLVLVVTIPNDLVANIDPGDILAGSFYTAPHLRKTAQGFEVIEPLPPNGRIRLLTALARRSDLVLYLLKFYQQQVGPRLKEPPPTLDWAGSPIYALNDTSSARTDTVWEALQWTLREFTQAVRDDGRELALAYMNPEDVFYWYPGLKAELPETVVSDWWDQQYRRFALETDTETFDLGRAAAEYILENDVDEPYLSYPCDPHFSPMGQRVVADLLFDFMATRDLVPPSGIVSD